MFINKEDKRKIQEYKDRLAYERRMKEEFLSQNTDWTFLESLIIQCNKSPDLRFEVQLKDGTILRLKTYEERRNAFDGEVL